MNLVCFATTVLLATPVDFDTDVLPVLTNRGCNAAACHGAAAGRGGFKLSLFGGDPESDFHAIARELEGRRINPSRPAQSLILLKPTGQLDHEGGVRFADDDNDAALLAEWIRGGAKRLEQRRLIDLQVTPGSFVARTIPDEVEVRVVAKFDDGVERDVTRQTVYSPADPAAVQIASAGTLTLIRRGQHVVVARYLSLVRTIQLTAPLSDDVIDVSSSPRANWIDDEILATLEMLRLAPSPQADDATMLRRATLNLTGRLPGTAEVRRYAADPDDQKFPKLIDRLLESPEAVDYWAYEYAKLLRIRLAPNEPEGAHAFHRWLRDCLENETPWDRMAAQLVTAEGDTHIVGPANFYRVVSGPRAQAEYATEVLMGVRLRCANCHNHPLDRWTQDDYHGLAALFAGVEQGRMIRVNPRGEVTHPGTGGPALPKIPGRPYLDQGDDGRIKLAQWLTEPDNPFFAKAHVNRLWKHLMGRGLIEPTDDLRETNPATHPRLLDRLADEFVASGYNVRHILRLIATSAAYARSSRVSPGNRSDDRFYSHALAWPLEAEVLADALADVTGIAETYGDQSPGTRAVNLVDPQTPSESLDILGRCSRQETCETPGNGNAGGLTAKLHLLNGALVNDKVTSRDGWLQSVLDAGLSNEQIVERAYLRALSRFPDQRERRFWKSRLPDEAAGAERRKQLEDFLWSLVCCREFVTHH